MKCIVFFIIINFVIIVGCSGSNPFHGGTTVQATDLARDTELASEKNLTAIQLCQSNQYDQARRELLKAIDADPMFGPAHNNIGKIYYRDKDYYKAAQEFEYAAKLMPEKPQPHNNLGLVYETTAAMHTGVGEEKKLDMAISSYRKAVELDSNNPEYLGNLVRARIRRGLQDEETHDYLQKLIEIDSRDNWISWAKSNLSLYHKYQPAPSVKTANKNLKKAPEANGG